MTYFEGWYVCIYILHSRPNIEITKCLKSHTYFHYFQSTKLYMHWEDKSFEHVATQNSLSKLFSTIFGHWPSIKIPSEPASPIFFFLLVNGSTLLNNAFRVQEQELRLFSCWPKAGQLKVPPILSDSCSVCLCTASQKNA